MFGTKGIEPSCQCRRYKRLGFNPWVGKILWRRAWQPMPVFLPRESHGQRSLVGYSPWGCKEPDTTEPTPQSPSLKPIGHCFSTSHQPVTLISDPAWISNLSLCSWVPPDLPLLIKHDTMVSWVRKRHWVSKLIKEAENSRWEGIEAPLAPLHHWVKRQKTRENGLFLCPDQSGAVLAWNVRFLDACPVCF